MMHGTMSLKFTGPGVHLSSCLTITRTEGGFPTLNLHLAQD